MADLREVVAKNISTLRQQSGMTQLMLANRLNYSDKAISKWERGESFPDVFMLKDIADLFGVSVDYLLTDSHVEYSLKDPDVEKMIRRNRAIISVLANMLVWLMATVAFVTVGLIDTDAVFPGWLVFLYALPISCVVALVFNSIWGKRKLNYLIISLMSWFVLISIYVSFHVLLGLNIWLIFLIGIPSQIIISLWSGLNNPNEKLKKKRRKKDDSSHDASA